MVEVGETISVVHTNELDCAVVEMGIEIEVSHDIDDEIELVDLKQYVAWIGFSVEVSEIISDVGTNELDCSVVENGFKFDVSHDVDDGIKLVQLG